jgi:hypothetical protein
VRERWGEGGGGARVAPGAVPSKRTEFFCAAILRALVLCHASNGFSKIVPAKHETCSNAHLY